MILEQIPIEKVTCVEQINPNTFRYCEKSYYFTLPKRYIKLIDYDGNIYTDYVIDCYDNEFKTSNNHNNIVKVIELITTIRLDNIDINKHKLHFDYVRDNLPTNNIFKKSLDYLYTNILKIKKSDSKSWYEITIDLMLSIEYEIKIIKHNNYTRNILMKDLYFDRAFNLNKFIIDKLFELDLIKGNVVTNYSISENKALGNTQLLFQNNFIYLDKNYC